MERTDTHVQHGRLRGVAGFSLIELLIALAIGSILALSLWSLASTQEKTYGSQDSATEMQQNLRVALQSLTRDITAAGLGPQSSTINGQYAGAWYNAANNWNAFNITATSIDIIGCGQTSSTLSSQAASGTNTLVLTAGEGAGFTASQNINIEGTENAVVASVGGDTLTLTGNLGLTHPAQATVYPLRWATYSVTGGVLNMDQHNGNGPQAVASDITAMTITANAADLKALTVSITGSTGSATAPVTSTVTDTIYRRNLQPGTVGPW
jgi:prepilin-type N-terminal cleavage/methylation domain-containing protein